MIIGITIVVSLIIVWVIYLIGFIIGARWYVSRMIEAIDKSDLSDAVKLRISEILMEKFNKK